MKFTLIKLSINQSLTRLLIKFYKKICYKTSLKINKIILGSVSPVLHFYNLPPLPVASIATDIGRKYSFAIERGWASNAEIFLWVRVLATTFTDANVVSIHNWFRLITSVSTVYIRFRCAFHWLELMILHIDRKLMKRKSQTICRREHVWSQRHQRRRHKISVLSIAVIKLEKWG